MEDAHIVRGFSRLSRIEKLKWLEKQGLISEKNLRTIHSHLHPDREFQEIYSDISENTVSNFFLPFGLAPNFLINGDLHTIPMVTEESSVVAAASHAARFWAMHGGFHAEVKNTLKTGQVHFRWPGHEDALYSLFRQIRGRLLGSVSTITRRMEDRGGGIESLEIRKTGNGLPGLFQLFVTFRTADAMGANFINSALEAMAGEFRAVAEERFPGKPAEIIMSILSNYTPDCLVNCRVEADRRIFDHMVPGMKAGQFVRKFISAVEIARNDRHRAVTHNKGIFNGMDAVVIATGNDFRAVEACGHAYASRNGSYESLSTAELSGSRFSFILEVPLAVGTVGGLTRTHPMAAAAMEILGHPDAEGLMKMIAAAGLASHFSAIRSLVTSGIQYGHMKMHLGNILRQLNATVEETGLVMEHFEKRTISHAEVADFLQSLRDQKAKE
jgi:hydroxymethylglutaryl-CoA reductase